MIRGWTDSRLCADIWAVVDAKDRATADLDPHNRTGALCRHEWLQVLVRLAVRRFLPIGPEGEPMGNVAEALEAFCTHVRTLLPPLALLNGDEFRTRQCYQERTDSALRQYEPFLRNLFAAFSELENGSGGPKARQQGWACSQTMCIGEWLELCTDCGLIELGLVSPSTAMHAFSMSRLRGRNDYSTKQEARFRALYFEDFLEALVRLAYVIALPTAEELIETSAADAGDFLLALHVHADVQARQFVARRAASWLGPSRQRIHRCLEMMFSLMTRLVEANAPRPGANAPPSGG